MGGFGGSVPVAILMATQQFERLGGLGEDADGFGAAHLDGVGVALPGQDVGDPVDGGLEPDRITRIRAGDNQLQAVLAATAEPHEPLLGSESGLLFGADRIGFDDLRVQQGL